MQVITGYHTTGSHCRLGGYASRLMGAWQGIQDDEGTPWGSEWGQGVGGACEAQDKECKSRLDMPLCNHYLYMVAFARGALGTNSCLALRYRCAGFPGGV